MAQLDNNDTIEPINDYLCKFKSGAPNVECRSHKAALLRYLGYARLSTWTLPL